MENNKKYFRTLNFDLSDKKLKQIISNNITAKENPPEKNQEDFSFKQGYEKSRKEDKMLNQVVLQGRLTANPELKHTQSNIAVTSFSIAVEENRTVNDERKTNFFKCVAWRNCAEFICKYFEKGKPILINGELKNDTYTDKNNVRRTDTIVVVSGVNFCGAKSNESQSKDFEQSVSDDDIPPVE